MTKLLLTALTTVAFVVPAHALVVVVHSATGTASTLSNATGLPLQKLLPIPKFDPALGRLQSVTISYSFAVRIGGSFSNFSPNPIVYTGRVIPAVLTLRDATGATIASGTPQGLTGGIINPFSSANYTLQTPATTGALAPLSDLFTRQRFTGTGDYQFTYYGDPDVRETGFSTDHVVQFGTSVGYLYSLPEPATWAMMLIGFTGVGTAMRRRPSAA